MEAYADWDIPRSAPVAIEAAFSTTSVSIMPRAMRFDWKTHHCPFHRSQHSAMACALHVSDSGDRYIHCLACQGIVPTADRGILLVPPDPFQHDALARLLFETWGRDRTCRLFGSRYAYLKARPERCIVEFSTNERGERALSFHSRATMTDLWAGRFVYLKPDDSRAQSSRPAKRRRKGICNCETLPSSQRAESRSCAEKIHMRQIKSTYYTYIRQMRALRAD
jgi:hypothetical protein